jgi:hypothetical protein
MPSATWAVPSPASKYGASFMTPSPATNDDTPLVQIAGPAPAAKGQNSLWHPNSPLAWVGIILAGAVGLAAFSTTVRVGPVKASASVGHG